MKHQNINGASYLKQRLSMKYILIIIFVILQNIFLILYCSPKYKIKNSTSQSMLL